MSWQASAPCMPSAQTPWTISQLSTLLRQHIEQSFGQIAVQGEVSGCKKHSSGHTYFALKDENAVLDAVCWRGTRLNVALSDGMLVTCRGRITTYAGRSKYQMIVESAEPAGQGLLLQKIEQLRAKLAAEGLFDSARKKPLPAFPRCIGLITSPTGAVIQDMITRFAVRIPCRFLLYPATVQGPSAVRDICQGMTYFQQLPAGARPDVLIIARGGGSIEDLWAFHDETLVRAVAACHIPVISAVGHETDTTLIDHAADVRAPTPTAAAEMVLPLCTHVMHLADGHLHRLTRGLDHSHRLAGVTVASLSQRLKQAMTQSIWIWDQRLDDSGDQLGRALIQYLDQKTRAWANVSVLCTPRFQPDLTVRRDRLDHWIQRLGQAATTWVERQDTQLNTLARMLEQLSYQGVLARGFAMVTHQGHVCTLAANARTLPQIDIHFSDGIIQAQPLS